MAGIKHATKKKFNRSTTRKKTIQSGISSEFSTLRSQLTAISTSVRSLVKTIGTARDSWLSVAKEEKVFAETLSAAFHDESDVKSHAKEVETAVHQMQQKLLANEGPEAPHNKVIAVLQGYLKQIEDIEKDCADVETSYTEVLRYQKKVDKMQKKPGKRQKQLQRNLEKLSVARGEHQTKLDDMIKRMKTAQEKHQVVFQCAHHAFWIAQDRYFTTVNQITQSVRWESVSVQERLMNVDFHATEKLEPIPRAVALLPPVTASEVTPPQILPPTPSKDKEAVKLPIEKQEGSKPEENKIPETPLKIPETPPKIPETPLKIPETPPKIPETPLKIPETPPKIPETPLSTPQKAVESEPVTPEVKAL